MASSLLSLRGPLWSSSSALWRHWLGLHVECRSDVITMTSSFLLQHHLQHRRRLSTSPVRYTSASSESQLEEPVIPMDPIPGFAYRSLISAGEIRQRQNRLVQMATEWVRPRSGGSPLLLIASSPPQFQANTNIPVNDCKQNSDFTYFTGLHAGTSDQLTSDCVLALFLDGPDQVRSFIFSPIRTKSDRLWHGPEMQLQYHDWLGEICDEVRPLPDLVTFVNRTIGHKRRDVFLSRNGLQFRPELVTHLKYYMKYPSMKGHENATENWSSTLHESIPTVNVRDASSFIDQLRVIKSEAECAALRRVGKIGARALSSTIQWTREMALYQEESPQEYMLLESHIGSKFSFESKLAGARRLSFPSVCASGARSTIIHYGRNDHRIDGRHPWVLTDVGCEDTDGYCCDISRTWPVLPTQDQLRLQLYEALIGVQYTLIESIHVGHTSLDDLYHKMIHLLSRLLITFNVFDDSVTKTDIMAITRKICPHHSSHYIGLDIHDTPSVSRSKPLQLGMCFSIEPGLYFPLEGLPIKPHFRGIGLRIEDDILIDPTNGAVLNLTTECPKLSLV